jgi:hypothetical protein
MRVSKWLKEINHWSIFVDAQKDANKPATDQQGGH